MTGDISNYDVLRCELEALGIHLQSFKKDVASAYKLRTIKCPACQSNKIWRDGKRKTQTKLMQRYLCRECGLRFSKNLSESNVEFNIVRQIPESLRPESDHFHNVVSSFHIPRKESVDDLSLLRSENITPHENTDNPQKSNKYRIYNSNRRVCASDKSAKNLVVVQAKEKTTGDISETKSLLIQFIFELKKRGNKETTIERRIRYLKELAKSGADLRDPESVRATLAEKTWVGRSKNNAADTYTIFLRMLGKSWEKPHYQEISKLPFVPTEGEIDVLIAGSGWKTSTFLQIMKETAMRPGEVKSATWDDIDFVSKTIRVTPEKGSNPRIFHLSDNLLKMLLNVQKRNQLKDANRIFTQRLAHIRRYYERVRKRQAFKLQNPRLKKIMMKTFRTWKATMLYHETKDPWYVMEFLGHKNLQHTRKYVILESALFRGQNDSFVCKVAKTVEEGVELVELGFEYINEINGNHLYRKRK